MPRSNPRIAYGDLLRLVGALVLAVGSAFAQVDVPGGQVAVTFQGMWQAVTTQDYTVVQLRRFFPTTGGGLSRVVTVREELRVVANGTGRSDYELDFLGVEGEPTGSSLWQQWSQNYAKHRSTFVEHGQFHIRDSQKVPQNYTLHDFGPSVRAGRTARRVVVFPKLIDKAIWLLEVDAATMIPLYAAEYDAQLRLLSEIEAVTFRAAAQLKMAAASSRLVSVWPDFQSAKAHMGNPAGIIDAAGSTGEYRVDRVKVRVDPLNNRQTMILEYTDGVDQFFVVETPGASDLFASLPLGQPGGVSHTIARYRDPAKRVLLFWDDNVAFQVAGRGSMKRLDAFAEAIYRTALAN